MLELPIALPEGKKFYFASDFHLGVPNAAISQEREKKIIQWLNTIEHDAAAIFLMGDIFDFWFEYERAIPKGFIRLQGRLASLSDSGLPIYIFPGNHDMWMRGYFREEFGATIMEDPVVLLCNGKRLLIGHGDGLGPGDQTYKYLKKIFKSPVARWAFRWLHPDIGISLAQKWSKSSRLSNMKLEEKFKGEEREFLLSWCREIEAQMHHDYYIFGHRHLPLDLEAGPSSRYINLGEWVHFSPYAVFDGARVDLKSFS
ncbi:MAG: UDP-2,3-diacylglucosamine diphosphatase [Cyclobacteriaceae bacterium]